MKIIWSPTSQERARQIIDYISEDNPDAALSLIDEFEEKVESLKQNPNLGIVISVKKTTLSDPVGADRLHTPFSP